MVQTQYAPKEPGTYQVNVQVTYWAQSSINGKYYLTTTNDTFAYTVILPFTVNAFQMGAAGGATVMSNGALSTANTSVIDPNQPFYYETDGGTNSSPNSIQIGLNPVSTYSGVGNSSTGGDFPGGVGFYAQVSNDFSTPLSFGIIQVVNNLSYTTTREDATGDVLPSQTIGFTGPVLDVPQGQPNIFELSDANYQTNGVVTVNANTDNFWLTSSNLTYIVTGPGSYTPGITPLWSDAPNVNVPYLDANNNTLIGAAFEADFTTYLVLQAGAGLPVAVAQANWSVGGEIQWVEFNGTVPVFDWRFTPLTTDMAPTTNNTATLNSLSYLTWSGSTGAYLGGQYATAGDPVLTMGKDVTLAPPLSQDIVNYLATSSTAPLQVPVTIPTTDSTTDVTTVQTRRAAHGQAITNLYSD